MYSLSILLIEFMDLNAVVLTQSPISNGFANIMIYIERERAREKKSITHAKRRMRHSLNYVTVFYIPRIQKNRLYFVCCRAQV